MRKEINMLGSLSSAGGGEQSLCTIANALRAAGWTVHLYPWAHVADKHNATEILREHDFLSGRMLEHMKPGLPLFFYGNDQIYQFSKEDVGGPIVEKCSTLHIGINFALGDMPKRDWMAGKLRQVMVQNAEKRDAYYRKRNSKQRHVDVPVLSSPINLAPFLDLPVRPHDDKNAEFVILKHCTADARKFVTDKHLDGGDKSHVWQHHIKKISDVDMYTYLLAKLPKQVVFRFMTATSSLREEFHDEPRMQFLHFDEQPVPQYLAQGHLYLYRTSNHWNDQGPRCLEEAMASGLPVLGENRNGPADRIHHGDTGFYILTADDALRYITLLYNNEAYRLAMAAESRVRAKYECSVDRWVEAITRGVQVR